MSAAGLCTPLLWKLPFCPRFLVMKGGCTAREAKLQVSGARKLDMLEKQLSSDSCRAFIMCISVRHKLNVAVSTLARTHATRPQLKESYCASAVIPSFLEVSNWVFFVGFERGWKGIHSLFVQQKAVWKYSLCSFNTFNNPK